MLLKLLKFGLSLLLLAAVTNGGPKKEVKVLAIRIKRLIREEKTIIDGKFELQECAGFGAFSVVFKGRRTSDNSTIAMKFTPFKLKGESDDEFNKYVYLKAVNNMNVEQYGISPILYYNVLHCKRYKCMLAVFPFFDGGRISDKLKAEYFKLEDGQNIINSLIVFRDFVRQTKYMHSLGVRHDDIRPANFMFRKHQSFLIDFNLSSEMKDKAEGYTLEYASRRNHKNETMFPLDDWESFLYMFARIHEVELSWFTLKKGYFCDKDASFFVGEVKSVVENTKEIILKKIKNGPLKIVYEKLLGEVFEKDPSSTPDYDGMYKLINDQIEAIEPGETPVFSWLSDADKEEARTELPLADISKLIVPAKFIDFKYPKMPKPTDDFIRKGGVLLE